MIQNKEKVESRIILGADVAKASIVLKQLRDGHRDYQEFRAWGSGLSFRRLPA
jgi:hypothetical protein